MTKGYVITRWTEDEGLVTLANYPKSLDIDLDDMMRVFYAHVTGKEEAGNVMVRLEKARANVYSYFTGMESKMPMMLCLLMDVGEEPEMFGESLIKEINDTIIDFLHQMGSKRTTNYNVVKKVENYLHRALLLLERLKNLTREQTIAQIYCSEKGRATLELLQKGPVSKKNLQMLVEDKLDKSVSNLDIVLELFSKTNILQQDWIEGYTDIFLFLTEDFTLSRMPPKTIIERAKNKLPNPELANQYLKYIKEFYANYEPTEFDNYVLANNLINPDKFDFIALFRNKPYPLKKLPKSPVEGVLTIEDLMKLMEKDQIIKTFTDSKGIKWVFLVSDIMVDTFYPEYLIESVRSDHMKGILKKEIALRHLKFLENAYKVEEED
ncbi:MAG: hypothetical protein GY870_17925 [archaeon]|nr:hypothetical protein [archaeon]